MKTQKKASLGPIRLTVIIIGLAVVLASLGYLIWKNYLSPQQEQTTTQQPEQASDLPLVVPLETASDQTLGSGLVVEYPDGWTNTHIGAVDPSSTTDTQVDQNTLTSPTGAVQVLLTVEKNSQIGGLCSNDYIKLKYLSADVISDLPGARFVEYVVYYPNTNFYQYHIGVQKNTAEIIAVTTESNSACRFMYSEHIDLTSSLPDASSLRALLAIRFPEVGEGNNLKSGFSEAQVIDKLSGEEYEQAKAIVQSVRITQ